MENSFDNCRSCNKERLIVNKRHCLCNQCNYIRLHGDNKPKVYTLKRTPLKRSFKRVKKISSSNIKYRMSDGGLVTQNEINEKYKQACEEIKLERESICQGLGRSDLPLSFSHTISRARCKSIGKADLIWDKNNIELESFEAPSSFPKAAHNIWESGSIEQKMSLLNFSRKVEYIKNHDLEYYRKNFNFISPDSN